MQFSNLVFLFSSEIFFFAGFLWFGCEIIEDEFFMSCCKRQRLYSISFWVLIQKLDFCKFELAAVELRTELQVARFLQLLVELLQSWFN